jgi:hypothetical protein
MVMVEPAGFDREAGKGNRLNRRLAQMQRQSVRRDFDMAGDAGARQVVPEAKSVGKIFHGESLLSNQVF